MAVAATVLRGRHTIEQAKPIQLRGSALSAGTARLTLPKSLSPGRYSLRIRLLEATANGPHPELAHRLPNPRRTRRQALS